MRKYLSLTLSLLFILTSCAPATFVPREMPQLQFEKTPYYHVDLSNIPKPEAIKPIYVDENFEQTTPDKAKYVLLTAEEYAKIGALLKLCKAYKQVIQQQEVIINSHVDIINSLKEFVELERLKAKEYQNLWADSENAYRHEQYYHKLDNAINKGTFGLLSLGVIVALIAL